MSYTTFHKIRQLDNGDFLVTTKCSNDSAPPHEWTMDYYRKEFALFNNKQREAALILSGLYSGDVYYPERYKRMQKLAIEYSKKIFENTGDYPYPIYGGMSREGFERDKKRCEEQNIKLLEKLIIYPTYEDYIEDIQSSNLKAVDGFIDYVNSQEPEIKIKAKIKLNDGNWVKRLASNSRRLIVCNVENEAQLFNRSKIDIENLMRRIPLQYGAEMVII